MNLSGSKAGNEMVVVFFCKKVTFPQRRVHYVQYQYFLFYILHYLGGVGSTVQLHVQVLDANMSTI